MFNEWYFVEILDQCHCHVQNVYCKNSLAILQNNLGIYQTFANIFASYIYSQKYSELQEGEGSLQEDVIHTFPIRKTFFG